ncbi:class I SAM-dependent methyltransferase [Candidatus Uhrbacteria bacterium]|nr:class I SAM-dependent methyltransferase [Candidatus Uhrbacteria bacterium]
MEDKSKPELVDTFYTATTGDEFLERYLVGHDHLYGHMKEFSIKRELDKLLGAGTWNKVKILEVGAAGGIWTKYFLEKKASVTCVDILEAAVEANKKMNPRAIHMVGDAVTIQLPDRFDLIFMKDILEHVIDDEGLLKNMEKHLNYDGFIFVNTQNSFSLNYLIQGGYHRLVKKNKKWFGWDPTHVRFYNYFSLRKLLQKCELKPNGWHGDYFFPYRLITERFGGKRAEKKFLHLMEMLHLYNKFPLSITGWGIGVIASKRNKSKTSLDVLFV